MEGFAGGLTLLALVFVIIVAILWILLPFAVFGMKGLIREAIQEQTKSRILLERLVGTVQVQKDGSGRLLEQIADALTKDSAPPSLLKTRAANPNRP
jgi:hypothetical protein